MIVRALRAYEATVLRPHTTAAEQRATYEALRAVALCGEADRRPGATSDHSDFYDEFGLPK
ncbi:hypothetical protein [Methylobacterium nigriterrae]|uniref:hypothetical protein n=1 Tax=Methylobacterium nigriterrae TaxID=3127512 RepID=UPI003013C70D